MNRSIVGAWGTSAGSSGAGTGGAGPSRRTKISLNGSPAPVAAATGATASGSNSPLVSVTAANGSSPWIMPEILPPGSAAAAAAAAREQGSTPASPGRLLESVQDEGAEGSAMASGQAEWIGEDEEDPSAAVAMTMKRKARIAASGQAASPVATSKRRKAGFGAGSAGIRDASGSGKASTAVMPTARLRDLGGVTNALDQILELIAMPLCHPEIYAHTGVKPPRGVLLHGPPGCGKTMLAGALAGELNVPFLSISSPSIVSGTSGESEQTLRKLFDEAINCAPCILFLDEIDAITPKRETASREMERRIVAQLLTLLDDLTWDKTDGKPVMVIGATNRPDALDPALRRAGRFDHEIALGVPDEAGREEILRILCTGLRLSGDFDLRALAKQTPGYVGADLVALTAAAGIRAVKRIFSELAEQGRDIDMEDGEAAKELQPPPAEQEAPHTSTSAHALPSDSLFEALPPSLQRSAIATFLRSHPTPLTDTQLERLQISPQDFADALPSIQPSSKREGFATVPEVTWSDVGALEATREELAMTIVEPIKHPEMFRAIGVLNSGGVLLWGPPGCGKTLLAKAVANESGANFISVKGPELLNKYVGESERAVRQVFARARTSSPCVIFFDELDALVPRRDDSLSESSSRVVNTLLTELDGLEARVQTYVIGATNRPDMIDPAMCRPGRLDKLLYVDLPNELERIKILRTLTQKTPLKRFAQDAESALSLPSAAHADVADELRKAKEDGVGWLCGVAMDDRCDGFSGADLAALVREASVLALRHELRAYKQHALNRLQTDTAAADVRRQQQQQQQQRAGESAASTIVDPVSFSMGAPVVNVSAVQVDAAHFHAALDKVQPSVGVAQRRKYEALRSRLSGLPGGGGGAAASSSSKQRREADAGGNGEAA